MKRIEVIVKPEKVRSILDALKKDEVGGVTVMSAKGQGKSARPWLRGARGAALHTAEYNLMTSVITVIDDHMVDNVISAIRSALTDGATSEGKVFISTIDEAIDLESGHRGPSAL